MFCWLLVFFSGRNGTLGCRHFDMISRKLVYVTNWLAYLGKSKSLLYFRLHPSKILESLRAFDLHETYLRAMPSSTSRARSRTFEKSHEKGDLPSGVAKTSWTLDILAAQVRVTDLGALSLPSSTSAAIWPIARTPAQEAVQIGMPFPFLHRSLADLKATMTTQVVELQRRNTEHELVRQNPRARQCIYGLRISLSRAYRPEMQWEDIDHLSFFDARANAHPQVRAGVVANYFGRAANSDRSFLAKVLGQRSRFAHSSSNFENEQITIPVIVHADPPTEQSQ